SGSSIGLLAVHAPGLAVAKSSITSGKGASGAAGAEGLQLVPAASLDGDPGRQAAPCGSLGLACPKSLGGGYANAMGPARPGICLGEAGHDGEPGGRGGAAGVFRFVMSVPGGLAASVAEPYMNLLPTNGEFKTGATGGKGVDGASASTVGTLGLDGYVPEDGRAGTAGAPGSGGAGGNGTATTLPINQPVGEMWHGASGAGGGAGGCPGLAGKPGTGGGASIAIALFESPIVLDGVKLTAGTGGQGGAGTFGSSPTMGGAPGVPAAGAPNVAARGGNGGAAGISTNGSNGPSFGIYHSGAAPTVKDSVITPGAGGAAIDARSATDSVGNVRTIPAAPAGLSKDIFTL
ncbi:MAG: virulence associated protein, partial [Labilithrix sp.]|nr:virulence associated protein [Labilithrix sp.]